MSVSDESEEIRQLRSALRKCQAELARVNLDNEHLERELRRVRRTIDGAWEQLEVLRHSSSWRMTAPVRRVKAVLLRVLG